MTTPFFTLKMSPESLREVRSSHMTVSDGTIVMQALLVQAHPPPLMRLMVQLLQVPLNPMPSLPWTTSTWPECWKSISLNPCLDVCNTVYLVDRADEVSRRRAIIVAVVVILIIMFEVGARLKTVNFLVERVQNIGAGRAIYTFT